jgi:hypothetical protein
MRPFRFALIIVLLLSNTSYAQLVWKPWIVADGGPLWGSNVVTGDIRMQGGIKTNGWHIGIGAAYDPYRFRTLPLYVQGRRLFGQKKSKPFVVGSFGANIFLDNVHENRNLTIWSWPLPAHQYSNGIYAEAGFGWAFRTTKKWGFNLSLSYSQKTNTETYESRVWAGNNEAENGVNENKYFMNRLSLRMGIQL